MVAPVRLAAGFSGLRNRNTRVTNKTQLRVVRGTIEADPIILDDEDDEKNRILASQGVDEEDANEHHLQAALFASTQKSLSSKSVHDTNSYIPTPDAAGFVAEYNSLYPGGRYKDSATHLRFSDSIDESCIGGLSGSFTYFLDERDVEWLERNNGAARGEGTSADGGANGAYGSNGLNGANNISRGVPRTPHARSAKHKGKEPEHRPSNIPHQPSMIVKEDQFELVMGLFEKWTDESISPYLHLAHDTEHFPDFSDFERLFSMPLLPATFANFTVPTNVPLPEQMVQLARTIYPWWKERRKERGGHSIVPTLNVLVLEAQEKEDKAGGSPYICFRKRDVKPVRKTRTNNVTHTEKLTRLRGELQTSLELAQMVLQREKLKRESAAAAELVWRSRESFTDHMKQLHTSALGSVPPGDESLLFDKERKPRKQKVETTASGRIILTNRRLSQARAGLFESLDPHSPLTLSGDTSHAFEFCQTRPSTRTAEIQHEIDLELAKTRKDDAYWEDLVDMPYQPTPISGDAKFFKPAVSVSSSRYKPTSTPDAQLPAYHTWRTTRSIRLRVGRGGRLHFDRQLHRPKPHRLLQREWAGYPPHADDHLAAQEDAERWARRSWRPRNESGMHAGLKKERRPAEDYLAHPSIYNPQETTSFCDKTSGETRGDAQDAIIGFEQSGFGWDVHGHGTGAPGLARARVGRDDEGWKATPYLAVDTESSSTDVTTRNAMERGRLAKARHCKTVDDAGNDGGGALALFVDGGVAEHNGAQEKTSGSPNGGHILSAADPRNIEAMERAWRVDERWRYDSEDGIHGQDSEDRFLLDDFQSKFMRTTITLLDAQDHDIIKTDPQFRVLPPPKQNRYLDHQLRMQNPGLPPPSSSGSGSTPGTTPKLFPPRQIPPLSRSLASPSTLQNGNGVHAQLSLSPTPGLTAVMSGNGNGMAISNSSISPQKPLNYTDALGVTPNGARIPPDSSATVRVSTPMRTKQPPVGMSLSQSGLATNTPYGATNGNVDAASQGLFQSHPSSKSALGRVLAGQKDTPQQVRLFQKSGVNGTNVGDTASVNLPLGISNVHFKSQRITQLRAHGNGEHSDTNVSVGETQVADRYWRAEKFTHPT